MIYGVPKNLPARAVILIKKLMNTLKHGVAERHPESIRMSMWTEFT